MHAKQYEEYLQNLAKDLISCTNQLIIQINMILRQNLQKIFTQQNNISNSVYMNALKNKSMDKNLVDFLLSNWFKDQKYDLSKITNIINELNGAFNIDINSFNKQSHFDCDEIIFTKDITNGGIWCIGLNTLKQEYLDYAPRIGLFSHACKIDKENYFFHGGYISSKYSGKACKINLKQKTFESFPDGPVKNNAASVLKNNKIYIFGGYNGSDLASCETFDLKTKQWGLIQNLPKSSRVMMASLCWNNNIILSGYFLSCLYMYNDLVFAKILNLPVNINKIVVENWIFVDKTLYEYEEIKDGLIIIWSIQNNGLWIYTAFKKQYFIYFIDASNQLMRFNAKTRKIEIINYN